jgi:hypothetical protein
MSKSNVTLDAEAWDRLYTWIDLNVPDHGTWSEHRTISGAVSSLFKDKQGCKAQGGYSDAAVYEWSDSRSAWVMYVWPG